MSTIITLSNIEKNFADKKVLKGINLNVEKGEILGLLGPSGAGKTTLIKILTGQLQQSGGEAKIWGKDNRKLSPKDFQKVGMMLDNFGFYERLTCYDNMLMFAEIYSVPKTGIEEVLKEVNLWEDRKKPVNKLSKGMRGRLSLARAFLNRPEILFLDEPTTGLDPATAASIHQLIMRQKEAGTTIFLTTHNMEEAHKLCDHVALLHEGTIVEYGEPSEVCRKYNHQNKIVIRLKDGQVYEMKNEAEASAEIAAFLAADRIETIHSTEPNLETIFMELTGRKLGE